MTPSTPRWRTPTPEGRRRLISIGVGALAVAALVLAVLALTQHRGPSSPAAGSTPQPTGTFRGSATPAPAASHTPTAAPPTSAPPPDSPAAAPPSTRLLAAVDGARVYRATAGQCPDPRTTLERSNDGGQTWETMDVAGVTGSTAALRLSAGARDFVDMVTLSVEGCTAQYVRSFVGGADWEVFNDELAGLWFFDPAEPGTVHSPRGDKPAPCDAVALAATLERAAVLCADGSLHTSGDFGETWANAETAPAAVALTVSPNGYRVAVLNSDGCVGVQVRELAEGVLSAPGECLAATASADEVAMTTAGDGSVYVWAGDAFARSANGGEAW